MGLHIPRDAECLVPGCTAKPHFILSLRMRRHDSGATWAPNQPAYFCDKHANNGSEILVHYMPTLSHENCVTVIATVPDSVTHRTTPIR